MHSNKRISKLLRDVNLGASVAEADPLLETARIETSAFADLLSDRVDLIPGTKGSGKSALFRIFVDFLPEDLLHLRKVVVAHGVQASGDPVFHAFHDEFSQLSEQDFVGFWCIYLISLAHEQFVRGDRYEKLLGSAKQEVRDFEKACAYARIPAIQARKSLLDILAWSLNVLRAWRPQLKFSLPHDSGELDLDLFGHQIEPGASLTELSHLPTYLNDLKCKLEAVLDSVDLSLWLMVDRLDEIFPRRSEVERLALRGLLHAMRHFTSKRIKLKLFLRDDMLEHVVRQDDGFTALTHVTARAADTIRWTEDQILALVVRRFFANARFAAYLQVDGKKLETDASYRKAAFYQVFPDTVFRGTRQSSTMKWLFNHCADGRGVVTPRDVLDLIIRAVQKQQDLCSGELNGTSERIVSASAIKYGFEQLSHRKKETYLRAEFPHWWKHLKRFVGGKTEYTAPALSMLLGSKWRSLTDDFVAIGFLYRRKLKGDEVYSIPALYRHGLGLTQGRASSSFVAEEESSPVPLS